MKLNKTKLLSFLSLRGNRANLFYVFAFAPLLLVFYYGPFNVIIPFYGFLILFLKRQKLHGAKEANLVQKTLGSIVAVGSFFVYYVVALVFPGTSFYTTANYTVYLLGLFLVFFKFSALKEAFTPVFLIVTAFSSSFIVGWLRPFLSPYVNDFAHITVNVLRTLGIDASISYYRYLSNTPIISLTSLSGEIVQTTFVYGCMGIYSVLIFSVLLVVILFEDPSSSKVKLTYSIVGLLGTFVLNIFRFAIILLVDYFYGAEVGGAVHYVIGYVLFSAWLGIFFYMFSKRRAISRRFQLIWQKLRSSASLSIVFV